MIPFDRVIWDSEQCAEYLKESVQVFQRKTSLVPGFPAPLPNFTGKRPRWSALAVTEWALATA